MESRPVQREAAPHRRIGLIDGVAMIAGLIIGAGIFRAAGPVAAGVDGTLELVGLWLLGGALSVVGALCYAELMCAFPGPAGEYGFLRRAFGRQVSFLFAWARLTVTCTGSIAILAFVFGDYASELLPLGERSSALYGAGVVILLTGANALGLRFGSSIQNTFTALLVAGLVVVAAIGLAHDGAAFSAPPPSTSSIGLAMVFVLLTYGGWNEAAYLSSEMRGGPRRMAIATIAALAIVAALYAIVNLAYVSVLGLDGLRRSTSVGAEMMSRAAGPVGAQMVSLLIAAAAITSINATIVTGSRSAYALGRDFRVFGGLARWDTRLGASFPALLVQCALVLALIGLGALGRSGFETMVEYTAPVFWGFFLLTGVSLFVLRAREPAAPRPFRVPLYPLLPLLFCASCAWLLHASILHTGFGATVGLAVLALGAVPLALEHALARSHPRRRSP
jgi:basic amino acid/polyamine antiporter, APA family